MSRYARTIALWLAVLAPLATAAGQAPSEDPQKGAEATADPSAARPPRRPTTSAAAKAPVEKGIDFLLRTQRRDGSWGTGESARPIEVIADVPGSHDAFRVGTTALAVIALSRSPFRESECREAVRRGLEFLLEHCRVRRPNGMELYNVWSFAYSLRAFATLLPEVQDQQVRERMKAACVRLIEALGVYQTPDGGWGYYDFDVGSYRPSDSSMTFTTATVLVSLHAVERQGIAVPRQLLDRALRCLRRSRKDDGSYIYGPYTQYRPQAGYNDVKGSLGRTQSCNLALWLYGEKVTEDDLRAGIERFFRHHRFIDIGRKRPWPHEAWYFTSGYYFYYGHFYAGLVIDVLPEADRARWRPALEKILLERQEEDGSWWDFPFYGYHKPYGTAYAVLTLLR